ncbi:unnamed protein product [Diamesa tonsa]
MKETTKIVSVEINNNEPSKKEPVLSDEIKKIAKDQLREDERSRKQSLKQMREWLSKNKDVENVRTDDKFLLRFLRCKKFSVPMAQQQLLKYLNLKRAMPHLITNLDYLSPVVKDVIDNGYIFASPIRDSKGRRVLFYFAEPIMKVEFTDAELIRSHFIAYETLLESEENQILGFVHVICPQGALLSRLGSLKNPVDSLRIIKWGEKCVPMRQKEVHVVSLAKIFTYILDAVASALSKKINDRLSIHSDYESLQKEVDAKVLPKEIGGEIPMAEMIRLWKIELASKRQVVIDLEKMKLLDTKGIIGKQLKMGDKNHETNSINGSFKQLEFD